MMKIIVDLCAKKNSGNHEILKYIVYTLEHKFCFFAHNTVNFISGSQNMMIICSSHIFCRYFFDMFYLFC